MRKQKKLTLMQRINLGLLADLIERDIDATLGGLIRGVADGDDTALVPAVDRLKELGREKDAEKLKRLVLY